MLPTLRMALALTQVEVEVEVEVEQLYGVQVEPEDQVLDGRLDSMVDSRGHTLNQNSVFVDYRHVGRTYRYVAVHSTEVEDRTRH